MDLLPYRWQSLWIEETLYLSVLIMSCSGVLQVFGILGAYCFFQSFHSRPNEAAVPSHWPGTIQCPQTIMDIEYIQSIHKLSFTSIHVQRFLISPSIHVI